MKKKYLIFTLIGIIFIIIGIFLVKKNNRIVCLKHNKIWDLEKIYEVDNNGKAISYEFNLATDYGEKSDDEFKIMCDDIEDINTYEGITESTYCDFENKKYHHDTKYSYDKLDKYESILKDKYEYIDYDGILKKDEWIKAMENDGYTCD